MAGDLSAVWRRSLLYSLFTADWAVKSIFCRIIAALLQKMENYTGRGERKEAAAGLFRVPEASGMTLLLAVALLLPFLRFRTLFALEKY